MKKNFKIAAILMIIAAVCAAAVSGMYKVTSGKIEANQLAKELKLYQEIFPQFNIEKKPEELVAENAAITKKIVAKNQAGEELGLVYVVSGKNSYGPIVLLVGIDNEGKLVGVEFLENGQSYSSEVETHVDSKYTSGLSLGDITAIDKKCGATYGAKTVKELVTIAFNDYNNGGAQ